MLAAFLNRRGWPNPLPVDAFPALSLSCARISQLNPDSALAAASRNLGAFEFIRAAMPPVFEPSLESLDPEDHGPIGHAVEGFDLLEGVLELAERAGVEKEDHVDELGVRLVGLDG